MVRITFKRREINEAVLCKHCFKYILITISWKYIMTGKMLTVLKSLIAAYAVTIILLLITAGIMYKFYLNENTTVLIINFIYVLSTAAGGLICAKAMNNRRILWSCLLAFLYVLALLIISFIIGAGELNSFMNFWKITGLCLLGGVIGGVIS